MMKWISVKDRLPPEELPVAVTGTGANGRWYFTAFVVDGEWTDFEEDTYEGVDAVEFWAYYPPPAVGGTKEGGGT